MQQIVCGGMPRFRWALALAGVIAAVFAGPAFGGTPAPGYAATDFVTGIANNGGVGPVGLAFDSTNRLYVMDYATGILYRFGASGGAADPAHALNPGTPIPGAPAGIAFDKTGRLFVAQQASNSVAELDPATGHVLQTYSIPLGCPTGIATDPIGGLVFVTSPCGGPVLGFSFPAVSPGFVLQSAVVNVGGIDGITFGPDGTFYLARFGTSIWKAPATNAAGFGTATQIAAVPLADGIAVATSSDPTQPPFLFANRNDGIVTKVDLTTSPPTLSNIFSGGSRGDFSTVGPDGCLYITQTDRVVKITNADGTCSLAPTSALPLLGLAPATITPAPHVGETATFSATLTNVPNPAGTTITFTITGANPQTLTASANAAGVATITYAGANTGLDTIVASTTVGTLAVSSNPATVDWQPPLDTTPPSIVPTITGTLGDHGWYTSPVTVTWTVSDPESGIASTSGCDPWTTSTDTAGVSQTCSATNGVGLSASDTESVKVDQTAPTVTYSAHPATYDVDQTVSITCTAFDALSLLASDTCAAVSGPAYSFGLGTSTFSATATDNAGNVGNGSTSFTVVVSTGGLCSLVQQFVAQHGIANSLCVKLDAGAYGAFRNELRAQSGKALTAANAALLTQLSLSL